jgi:hypothetical protein
VRVRVVMSYTLFCYVESQDTLIKEEATKNENTPDHSETEVGKDSVITKGSESTGTGSTEQPDVDMTPPQDTRILSPPSLPLPPPDDSSDDLDDSVDDAPPLPPPSSSPPHIVSQSSQSEALDVAVSVDEKHSMAKSLPPSDDEISRIFNLIQQGELTSTRYDTVSHDSIFIQLGYSIFIQLGYGRSLINDCGIAIVGILLS